MQFFGGGHEFVTDADRIPGRNYLLNTSQALSAKVVDGVGFVFGKYQFSSALDFNKKYLFHAILYSDKDGGMFYCGSDPNWSVYYYQNIKKGENIISFPLQAVQESNGIKFTIDNCSAQVSLTEATLNEGTIIKEWQPASEDYVMKSDQEPKALVGRADAFSIAETYQGDLTYYGGNTNITDLPSEPNLNSQSTFLVRTFEMPVGGNKFIYQLLLWDGNNGMLFYRATWQDRQGLLQAKWHKISSN